MIDRLLVIAVFRKWVIYLAAVLLYIGGATAQHIGTDGIFNSAAPAAGNPGDNTTMAMGSGLNFASLASYFNYLPSTSTQFTGPFTISFWVQTTALSNSSVTTFVVQSNRSGLGFSIYDNGPNSTSEVLNPGSGIPLGGCNTTNTGVCISRSSVNDGSKHLIVAAWDGFYALSMYVDGTLIEAVGQSSLSICPCNGTIGPGTVGASSTNITMIDLRYYGLVLSQAQISAIYALGQSNLVPTTTNSLSKRLMAYWPMSTSTIHITSSTLGSIDDVSGNGNTAYLETALPSVSITSPAPSAVLTGGAVLTAAPTDSVGVYSVQFSVDGVNVGPPITSSPWSYTWNSASIIDGSHSIGAVATNYGFNTASATPVSVTTSNGTMPNNYYFANAGSDTGNNCQTQITPCQTITKANSLSYGEGDTINFNGGDNFTDACLSITSANSLTTPSNRVTITSTPGSIGLWKLTAPCTGTTGAVVIDNAHVTIQNCQLVGPGASAQLQAGIWIRNFLGSAALNGVTVQNCTIGGFHLTPTNWGAEVFITGCCTGAGKALQNISVLNNTLEGLTGNTSVDDNGIAGFGSGQNISGVLYQGNLIANIGGHSNFTVSGTGIIHNGQFGGVTSQYNLLHDLGGNMTSCGGPVGIEVTQTDGAVVRMNEAYNVTPVSYSAGCDWDGFDLDEGTTNAIEEYNYSHNNLLAGHLHFMQASGGFSWGPNTIRYGISENDNQLGSPGWGAVTTVTNATGFTAYTYNMTEYTNKVFNGSQFGSTNVGAPGWAIQTANSFAGLYANNIYLGQPFSQSNVFRPISSAMSGFSSSATLENNDYYAFNGGSFSILWANATYSLSAFQTFGKEQNTITTNPNFVGSPPAGTCSWTPSTQNGPQAVGCPSAYALNSGSGARSAGADLTATVAVGAQDYYGNTIPGTGPCYNIGAYGICP